MTNVKCDYCEGKGTRNEQTFDYSSGRLVVGRADVECRTCKGKGELHPLLDRLCRAASDLSFYNAGEGACYQRETGARLNARDEYDRAYAEVEAAGLLGEFDRNQYLV